MNSSTNDSNAQAVDRSSKQSAGTPAPCCSTAKQATCCEPSAKEACCGAPAASQRSAPSTCGCQ